MVRDAQSGPAASRAQVDDRRGTAVGLAVEATDLLLAADDAIPPEVAVASGVSQAKGIETKTA